jgi:hypothetical protein
MKNESHPMWGVVRTVLMTLGAFLIGHNFFGVSITESWIQEAVGVVISLSVFVWSYASKETTVEGLQGILRQLFTFTGALLLAKGWITSDMLVVIISLIPVIGPALYAWLSRFKTRKLDDGSLKLHQLKQ